MLLATQPLFLKQITAHETEGVQVSIKKSAIVLNGFIHDFATGYWLSSMIAIYFMHNFQAQYPVVAGLLNIVEKFFFWNTIGAVVVILATGSARTFTYVDNFYGPEAEETRRRMLVIKHVILLAIFGAGGYWAYLLTFN
jgi:uncharacterized membrane protein